MIPVNWFTARNKDNVGSTLPVIHMTTKKMMPSDSVTKRDAMIMFKIQITSVRKVFFGKTFVTVTKPKSQEAIRFPQKYVVHCHLFH
jgi:hypothetical protein